MFSHLLLPQHRMSSPLLLCLANLSSRSGTQLQAALPLGTFLNFLPLDFGPTVVLAQTQGKSPRQDIFTAVHLQQVPVCYSRDRESTAAGTVSFTSVSPTASPKPLSSSAQKGQLTWRRTKMKPVNQSFFPSLCSHITWPQTHQQLWPFDKPLVVRFLHFWGHDANTWAKVFILPMDFSFIFSLLSRELWKCLYVPLLATWRLCAREMVREKVLLMWNWGRGGWYNCIPTQNLELFPWVSHGEIFAKNKDNWI